MLALDEESRAVTSLWRKSIATQEPTFEDILNLAKQLTASQKLRLIEAIVLDLEEPLQRAEEGEKPLRSLYGLWKDFGVSISVEDIDEARREMWGNFPWEDK
jgi:hypothetical protein